MLWRPVLVPDTYQPFYFDSCRLAMEYYSKLNHYEFNQLIADFLYEDFSLPSSNQKIRITSNPNQKPSWENKVKNYIQLPRLKAMLYYESVDNSEPSYSDTSFCSHTYAYAMFRRMNETKEIYYKSFSYYVLLIFVLEYI